MKVFNIYEYGVDKNFQEFRRLIGTSAKDTEDEAKKEIALKCWGKDRAEFMEGYLTAHPCDIEFEFESWAEKANGHAHIVGYDNQNRKYEASGSMGAGEIVEVWDIENEKQR